VHTITLSETAVALLRFRVKKWPVKVRERDLAGYRELVDAGIMMADGGDFRFTEEGGARAEELLREAEDRIERERLEPPDASDLSDAANELLRTCIDGEHPDGDETNRQAYRELVKARIMMPMGSFTKGNECVFRFTYWGRKLRYELLDSAKEKENLLT
jgi:hypothetical protein